MLAIERDQRLLGINELLLEDPLSGFHALVEDGAGCPAVELRVKGGRLLSYRVGDLAGLEGVWVGDRHLIEITFTCSNFDQRAEFIHRLREAKLLNYLEGEAVGRR